MAGHVAIVAATASTATLDAQSRALSLDVADTLAVVALLALGGPGKRALVALVVCELGR